MLDQLLGELVPGFKAGDRIARFGEIDNQLGVDLQAGAFGKITNSFPARRAIGQGLGTADESNFPVSEGMEMFERAIGSQFIVDNYGADRVGLQFAADHGSGNAAFLQIGEHVDFHEQPIRKHDQRLYATVEKHLEVAFETAAFIVNIGEDRKIGRLI